MDISFEGYESPSSITENRKNVKDLVIEMTAEPRQAWISAWEPAVKYSTLSRPRISLEKKEVLRRLNNRISVMQDSNRTLLSQI